MGYYIETDSTHGKAQFIIETIGATRISGPPKEVPPGMVPVCVVDNGIFEAAGIVFDAHEMAAFSHPRDERPKQWLLMSIASAEIACPKVKGRVKWV